MFFKSYKNQATLIFCIVFLVMAAILFQETHLPQFDAYYHTAMAENLFSSQFFSQEFPWLQETILKENFGNMHLLFHLLLTPFTLFGFIGVKFFTALTAALLGVLFYTILRKYNEEYAFIGTLLLFTASDFVFRIALPRAISLSLIFLFISTYLLLNKKYKWLLPIGFLYVWTYTGFIFLILISIVYFFVMLHHDKKEYGALIYPIIGILLGLIINPYFPAIIKTYYTQIFQISMARGVLGGAEWLPMDVFALILGNLIILCLLAYAVVFTKKQDSTHQFFLILTIIFAIYTLVSRKSIEFFIPFAVAYLVYAYSKLKISKKVLRLAKPILVVLIIFGIAASVLTSSSVIYNNQNYLIKDCAEFAKENIGENKILFNTRWDDFPALFYYNQENYYIVGLDPNFMFFKDSERYELYEQIIIGDEPLTSIEKFNSSHIITLKDEYYGNIYEKSEGVTETIFETNHCAILELSKE